MIILQINDQGTSSIILLKEKNDCLVLVYQFYVLLSNAISK
jgi:hypothetical protein